MTDGCRDARGWLMEWADGDLPAEQVASLQRHWRECAECRAARERFCAVDPQLTALGVGLWPLETAPARVWARLLARIDQSERRGRQLWRWSVATAALLAAAVILMVITPRQPARVETADDSGFVPIPFVPPMASYEGAEVVSREIPVGTLLSEGYGIAADPTSTVQADVLVGEDGQAYAVRLQVPGILKGIGD